MVDAGEAQRWSEVRMIIRRERNGRGHVVLTHRRVSGQRVWDRRLDQAVFPLDPGSPASTELLEALQLALDALRRQHGPPTPG